MVSVPARAAPEFDPTVYETTPFPVPEDPPEIDTKLEFEDADQAHPFATVTFTVPDPPDELNIAPPAIW